jgi:hypothetical protein
MPLVAWGSETVLANVEYVLDCASPVSVWRIIAGADDMTVSFDPPAPAPAGSSHYFAQQGEILQFESEDDHFVSGLLNNPADPSEPEAPFFAYQLMPGCHHTDCFPHLGDPMMVLSPPAGQYLDRYVFATDYLSNFYYDQIVVIRQSGTDVILECLGQIGNFEFSSVGGSDWEVARIHIDTLQNDPTPTCSDGVHRLTASAPVGLTVVGMHGANSYGYLGGIGVRFINPHPVIE